MAVAVLSTVFLVSSILFDVPAAVLATVAIGGTLCWSWWYLSLVTFARR